MANPVNMYAERTNQKLYFSHTALNRAMAEKSIQLRQFYIETALLHLEGALTTLLQELAHNYRVVTDGESIQTLVGQLAEREIVAPELSQLLQSQQHGFLGELLHEIGALKLNHHISQSETHKSETKVNLIQLNERTLPSSQMILDWYRQLQKMVGDIREQLVEF